MSAWEFRQMMESAIPWWWQFAFLAVMFVVFVIARWKGRL